MRDDHKNPPGPAGPATDDEQALRSLLTGAVQGLEPSEGALERLRCAVPARRARKRQALLVTAAAALLAGAAIPAALHLGSEEGATAGHSAMAGHGQAQGGKPGDPTDPRQNGSGGGPEPRPGRSADPGHGQGQSQGQDAGAAAGLPSPQASGSPSGDAQAGPSRAGAGAPTGAAGRGPLPPLGAAPGAPGCTADQLGVSGSARAPESDGKVYGSFKVTNVSAQGCTVTGPDTVTAAQVPPGPQPVPPAAPAVTVTGHTAGDPASALLPDPSAEAPVVLLQPYSAYEVRFAWVPSEQSCPAATPEPTAKPQEGGAAQPAAGPQGGTADGTAVAGTEGAPAAEEPQAGSRSPEPAGVEVSHAPGTGAPVTQTTIPAACGGTVYRTGLIPPGAP
ncbi:hypothetical protein [Streptomyces sp. NBC_00091]|uniref:hypothetical protein n=1 Tax=Streptomyces sp. NBC_00091 TaxID=2975648 RepID=UPI0022583F6B|nr:hypothetical protein [Streptomyces sp. NBC_00091]MCX5377496.1 hypothetical protein [Streptomyces sp. NBC_00091]